MPPILTTDRLTLTPVTLADLEDLVALWSNPTFTRHIMGRGLSEEEVWLRLLRDIGHWSVMGHGNWAIRRAEDHRYLGSVGIFDYRRTLDPAFTVPEVGWGVSPAFQGQGYAHEALVAALDWAETHLGTQETACMIGPDNAPSIRLAERVGYRMYAQTTYHDSPVNLYRRPSAREA